MNKINTAHLFSIKSKAEYESLSLEVFRFQSHFNPVYRDFVHNLRVDPEKVRRVEEIPFLPVEFFKSHRIVSGKDQEEMIFSSSGTTGMEQSRHFVTNVSIYEQSFREAFRIFYGDISQYCVLALLPSYLEREGSSLIYMVDDLIQSSPYPQSGYFLYNHQELYQTLIGLQQKATPTILIGVSYALLDFIEQYRLSFPELIVMETGGMKGKRKEIIREELHELLRNGFGVPAIHSEYGMTELLSQAYSKRNGIFACPPWMDIYIRDANDPLSLLPENKTGGINIIDLANVNSCSFIATQDLGQKHPDGTFSILGRFDNSDIRGCNLLVQ